MVNSQTLTMVLNEEKRKVMYTSHFHSKDGKPFYQVDVPRIISLDIINPNHIFYTVLRDIITSEIEDSRVVNSDRIEMSFFDSIELLDMNYLIWDIQFRQIVREPLFFISIKKDNVGMGFYLRPTQLTTEEHRHNYAEKVLEELVRHRENYILRK